MGKLVLLIREPGLEPRRVPLDEGVTTVGRTKDNTLVVVGSNVSREHCKLERKGDSIWLENVSKNGTLRNGTRVDKRVALAPGDSVKVGDVEVVLDAGGDKPAAPAADGRNQAIARAAALLAKKPAAEPESADASAAEDDEPGDDEPADDEPGEEENVRTPDPDAERPRTPSAGKAPAAPRTPSAGKTPVAPKTPSASKTPAAAPPEDESDAESEAAEAEAESEADAESQADAEGQPDADEAGQGSALGRRRHRGPAPRKHGIGTLIAGVLAFFIFGLGATLVGLSLLDKNKPRPQTAGGTGAGNTGGDTGTPASSTATSTPTNGEAPPTTPSGSSDDANEKWERLALLTPAELPKALEQFAADAPDDPRARDAAWIAKRLRQVRDTAGARTREAVATSLLEEAKTLQGAHELARARLVFDLVATVSSSSTAAETARAGRDAVEIEARAALQDLRDKAKEALERDGPVRALVVVLDGRETLRGAGVDDDVAELVAQLEEKAIKETASGGSRGGRRRGKESSGSNLREPLDLTLKLDLDLAREKWAALLTSPLTVDERLRVEWSRLWCTNVDRLFEELFKEANTGKKPVFTLRGAIKGAIVKADSKEIAIEIQYDKTDRQGEATVTWPLKRLEPAQVLELLEPLAGHDETKLLTLAFWALSTNHDERGHAYLIDILSKKKDSLGRVSSFLAIQTESTIPEGGYVVFEGRLISPTEKDQILEARKQAKEDAIAAAKDLANQRAKPKLLKYLARATAMCDEGYYLDGRSILQFLVKKASDIPGVGDVAKARLEAPYLRRRDLRKQSPIPGDQNGPCANRLDLYILGDGFSLDDDRQRPFDRFSEGVKRFVEHQDLFYEYDQYMNYWSVNVASKDEGVTRDSTKKDTALGFTIKNNTATVSPGPARALLDKGFPGENDQVAWVVGNGDAMVATAQVGGGVPAIPKNFLQSCPHEFGHAFASLGDEYEQNPNPGEKQEGWERPSGHQDPGVVAPNVCSGSDLEEVRKIVPWKHWFAKEAAEDNWTHRPVEVLEGASTHHFWFWRPQKACVMRDVGSPYCCACMEQMVLQMYKHVRPIDRAWPEDKTIKHKKGKDLTIRIALLAPRTHALETKWTIEPKPADAPPKGETGGSGGTTVTRNKPEDIKPLAPQRAAEAQTDLDQVKIPGKMLTRDMLVTVDAWDPTPWVLKDDEKLLHQRRTWNIEVE